MKLSLKHVVLVAVAGLSSNAWTAEKEKSLQEKLSEELTIRVLNKRDTSVDVAWASTANLSKTIKSTTAKTSIEPNQAKDFTPYERTNSSKGIIVGGRLVLFIEQGNQTFSKWVKDAVNVDIVDMIKAEGNPGAVYTVKNEYPEQITVWWVSTQISDEDAINTVVDDQLKTKISRNKQALFNIAKRGGTIRGNSKLVIQLKNGKTFAKNVTGNTKITIQDPIQLK